MARLRGRGLGAGIALATAAVVRAHGGIPMAPEAPPRLAARTGFRRTSETPEVVLVAEDYRTALALTGRLSWAKVIGIAAETAEPDAPASDIPAVVNVPGLMEMVEDDMLMLVDATHGVVLVNPDGLAIAQYQAEYTNLAPRRRLYLESEHLPAQTLDGRAVQVLARVETADAVETALLEGADALYVPFDVPLLPASASDAAQRRNLFALVERAAGKPLLLSDDYSLPLMTVLEAASRADITLAVPPREELEGLGLTELSAEFETAQAECFENEVVCSLPRLAADIVYVPEQTDADQVSARVEALAARGATRLVLTLRETWLHEGALPPVEALVAAAGANLLPVTSSAHPMFSLCGEEYPADTLETAVRFLVGMGVSGIIVFPGQVTAAKAMVREISFTECREALWRLLGEDGA
ncbi:MAG TPA: hypothetical protein VFB38_17505 [Chthonomonadaceae bacterium]|nr:hypothetical protein [Chthonomonadaceae bacterium]